MRYIIALLLTSTSLAGAARAEVPKVVTDIPPVQSLVALVMEGLGTPEVLLDRGASPHTFQMRPSQAAAVAGADLVVWIGPELAPWMDGAVDGRAEGAAHLELLGVEGTHLRQFAEGEGDDDDDHDHAAEGEDHDHEAEGEGEEHHHHSGTDPHAWLDPENAALWVDAIADQLVKLDPEHAALYLANADSARADIEAWAAETATILAPVKGRPFVVYHDAYGYYAEAFGLEVEGTVALGDAASPGAKRLADLRAKLQDAGPVCIFPEAQHDPALVEQMAEATGAKLGEALDPAGSTLEPGAEVYGAVLTGLAKVIAGCVAG